MMVTAAEPWCNSTELFITLPGRSSLRLDAFRLTRPRPASGNRMQCAFAGNLTPSHANAGACRGDAAVREGRVRAPVLTCSMDTP